MEFADSFLVPATISQFYAPGIMVVRLGDVVGGTAHRLIVRNRWLFVNALGGSSNWAAKSSVLHEEFEGWGEGERRQWRWKAKIWRILSL